ncbi:MAG: hypothetical protein SFW67_04900 [Myxococcaceae bacterium]|nr:hypothetical protein [Myxococcaceae bacterium]
MGFHHRDVHAVEAALLRLAAAVVVAAVGAGCPPPLARECLACEASSECGDGLTCVRGACVGADSACGPAPSRLVLDETFDGPLAARWAEAGSTASQALRVDPRAALGGDGGLLLVDTGPLGPGSNRRLETDFPDAGVTGDLHTRFAFRLDSSTSGGPFPVHLHSPDFGPFTFIEFIVEERPPTGALKVLARQRCPQGVPLDLGRWYRLQLTAEGLRGARPGRGRLFVDDGVSPRCEVEADFTSMTARSLLLGAPFADSAWVGTSALDNVEVTEGAMPPARLGLELVSPGPCTGYSLRVEDVERNLRGLLRPTTLALTGAAFFSDPACAEPITTLALEPGRSRKRFFSTAGPDTVFSVTDPSGWLIGIERTSQRPEQGCQHLPGWPAGLLLLGWRRRSSRR